ncbi:MAG: chemotaxis response regulator protein-glutamate methylesterase [Methylococcales bacterium]|nr:chemotaxis response regulator protein-glutamate methylesterase [Methylococcales bacterium]
MTIRVLIVDDSNFMCNNIRGILEEESDLKVVGVASNGKEAIALAAQLEPDVITMDVEMPVMDGITAVRIIMSDCPTPILMFSVATQVGAQATLDALYAGAIDFLPKQLDQIDGNKELAKRILRRRVRQVALQATKIRSNLEDVKIDVSPQLQSTEIESIQKKSDYPVRSKINTKIELLVIVASTGGPVAIQKVLKQLSSNCPFPILIVQHMPHDFTKSFADRLNQVCNVKVKEAIDGDCLIPGEALLAPGGMQMIVKTCVEKKIVSIREKQTDEIYSPCADITLCSVSEQYSENVLTVVLTGMGADGKQGATELKQKGLSIWVQDEESSTIYGMPKAIADANLAEKILSLDEIAAELTKLG